MNDSIASVLRFVRHPSYTGALMAFLGLALCLAWRVLS